MEQIERDKLINNCVDSIDLVIRECITRLYTASSKYTSEKKPVHESKHQVNIPNLIKFSADKIVEFAFPAPKFEQRELTQQLLKVGQEFYGLDE